MKTYTGSVASFLFLLVLCSCSSASGEATVLEMRFKGDGINVPFSASSIFSSVEYVKLKGCGLIGNIECVKQWNNHYLLSGENKLRVFDENGNFLFLIDKWGRAKDEYISFHSFDVNPRNGEISVFDQTGSKMLVYDSAGEYLRSFSIDNSTDIVRSFAVMGNGHYVFYNPVRSHYSGRERAGAWMVDSVGHFLKHLVDIEEGFNYGGISMFNAYFSHPDQDVVNLMGAEDEDRIYSITGEGDVDVAYELRCDLKIPKSLRTKKILSEQDNEDSNLYAKLGFFESGGLLLLFAFNNQKTVMLAYDKQNKVEYLANRVEDYIDDLGVSFFCGSSYDRMFSFYHPGTNPDIDKKLSVTVDSNPWLVIARTN